MGVGNSEAVRSRKSPDVTGSMGTSLSGGVRGQASPKTAVKNFYTTVDTATNGSNARIRWDASCPRPSTSASQLTMRTLITW